MKRLRQFAALCQILMFISLQVAAQVNPTRTLIAQLQPGEQPVTSECCFALSAAKSSVYLVTSFNGKFYAYENGQRKGPFAPADGSFLRVCPEDNSSGCGYYEHRINEAMYGDLISYEDDLFSVDFKGKKYGPFKMLVNAYVTPDGSQLAGLALDEEIRYHFFNSEGLMQDVGNKLISMHVSPSGRKVMVVAANEAGLDQAQLLNVDFSSMTMEQMQAWAKEMEEKQQNAPPPEAFVYFNDGKKFGPFNPATLDEHNPSFGLTGGDHWYMVNDHILYIDGIKVKDFGDTYINICDVWISSDGKRYAVATYDKVIFSDGKTYAYPLTFTWYEKGGQIYLSWVSLENEKDVVLYSRPL